MSDAPASVLRALGAALSIDAGKVTVKDAGALASPLMDGLVRLAVFGDEAEREWARWVIWEAGRAVGTYSSSIHDFYMARGRGDVKGVTVPAMNVRGASYDTARSIFRTGIKLGGGHT